MKNIELTLVDKLYIAACIVFTASTLFLYNQLPNPLGVHMSRGVFDQWLDIRLYLLLILGLMGGYFYYSKIHRGDGPQNRLFLIIILAFAHVMILYTNLVGPVVF